MYQTILIPTDGSEAAEEAVDHAVELARRFDATLHILYVVDTSAVDLSMGTEQVQRIKEGRLGEMKELKERISSAMARVEEKAKAAGVETVSETEAGRPHKQIATYADEQDIDLVVMSSHGRSGVQRLLLGSVTERVLRTLKRPVLVVDASG